MTGIATTGSTSLRRAALAILTCIGASLAAPAAADPSGTWLRETGESRVRFARCGNAYCGTVSWLKDPANAKAKVGQRIFYDMVASGPNSYAGSAFNPEDGRTYSGTMTLNGSRLTTTGCALAGLICRSINWSKVN